jgi:hypothetical protein
LNGTSQKSICTSQKHTLPYTSHTLKPFTPLHAQTHTRTNHALHTYTYTCPPSMHIHTPAPFHSHIQAHTPDTPHSNFSLRKIGIHHVIKTRFQRDPGLDVDNLGHVIREILGKNTFGIIQYNRGNIIRYCNFPLNRG